MVPWWPVPNASAASISMPILLGATRCAVMLAVHDEAAGRHGTQTAPGWRHPVLGLDRIEIAAVAVSPCRAARVRAPAPGPAARRNAP